MFGIETYRCGTEKSRLKRLGELSGQWPMSVLWCFVLKRFLFVLFLLAVSAAGYCAGEDILIAPNKPVAVFDATGETVDVLRQMDVPHRWFTPEAILKGATTFSSCSMLLIGKDSLGEAVRNFKQNIPFSHTVAEGLNVLVLSQKADIVAGLVTRPGVTGGVRTVGPGTGIFDNIPDRAIAGLCGGESEKGHCRVFMKPDWGNFRCLLNAEGAPGQTYCLLFRDGKGKILFSQLPLIAHYRADPLAGRLLRRMLADCLLESRTQPVKAGYLGNTAGKRIADGLRIDYGTGIRGRTAAFVWFPGIDDHDMKSALDHLSSGGVVMTCLPPGRSFGLPVELSVVKSDPENIVLPSGSVFAGLDSSDVRFNSVQKIPTIKTIGGKKAKNGVAGVIKCGKGWLVYIQLLPELFEDPADRAKVCRVWSTVMTNLGVRSTVAPDFLLSDATPAQSEGGWAEPAAVKGGETADRKTSPMYAEMPGKSQ